MKKELRDELAYLMRDSQIWITATKSIPLPVIVSFLLSIRGNPRVLYVGLYIYFFSFVFFTAQHVLRAKKKLKKKPRTVLLPGETPIDSEPLEKIVYRYPHLHLHAKRVQIILIIVTIVLVVVPPLNQPVVELIYGTSTPTPTSTSLPTLTPTKTLTATSTYTSSPVPTPTPKEQGIYYMFVLDASLKMMDSFSSQTKWDAALRAVDSILVGLEDGANYGLVAIGGTPNAGSSNPCDEPSMVTLPFSTREALGAQVSVLQPGGGGSLSTAFILAKKQFDDLPDTTARTLIYITGSEDNCESQDEWADLERYFRVKGDSGLTIYSEIIIIDDQNGLKTQTIADRISNVSNKVNAQAPQTIFQLVQTNNIVINNITNYVNITIASFPTSTPVNTNTAIVPQFTATNTLTPRPGETTVTPSMTAVPTATFTPTFTKTVTPSPIPSPTSACPLAAHSYLGGPGYGGSISLNSPGHCSTGHTPESPIFTNGSYSNTPDGTTLWVLVYAPDNLYYPQSPNACGGAPPPNQGGGSWDVNTYLGQTNDPPKWYDIVVVLADQAASDYLTTWLTAGCSSGFPGIDPAVLASMNITEKVYITVQTKQIVP